MPPKKLNTYKQSLSLTCITVEITKQSTYTMRITSERIASMRQYWRDGYSLPEIATMTKSTVATIKKYLKSDIQTYIGLTPEIKSKYEFAQKYEQLDKSDRQLDKAIAEVISLLSEAKKAAKKEFDTRDMEAINKLIDEVNSQLINPKELSFQKLKSYCGFKGIEAKGKTSEQLLEELAQIKA